MDKLKIPLSGFGTWRLHKPELESAIREAIKVGYRHFDGAAIYENESELGTVFHQILHKEQLISRHEVINKINLFIYFFIF